MWATLHTTIDSQHNNWNTRSQLLCWDLVGPGDQLPGDQFLGLGPGVPVACMHGTGTPGPSPMHAIIHICDTHYVIH